MSSARSFTGWISIGARCTGSIRRRFEDKGISLGLKVGAVVPARSGELVVATENGFGLLDPRKGRLTAIADPGGG